MLLPQIEITVHWYAYKATTEPYEFLCEASALSLTFRARSRSV